MNNSLWTCRQKFGASSFEIPNSSTISTDGKICLTENIKWGDVIPYLFTLLSIVFSLCLTLSSTMLFPNFNDVSTIARVRLKQDKPAAGLNASRSRIFKSSMQVHLEVWLHLSFGQGTGSRPYSFRIYEWDMIFPTKVQLIKLHLKTNLQLLESLACLAFAMFEANTLKSSWGRKRDVPSLSIWNRSLLDCGLIQKLTTSGRSKDLNTVDTIKAMNESVELCTNISLCLHIFDALVNADHLEQGKGHVEFK